MVTASQVVGMGIAPERRSAWGAAPGRPWIKKDGGIVWRMTLGGRSARARTPDAEAAEAAAANASMRQTAARILYMATPMRPQGSWTHSTPPGSSRTRTLSGPWVVFAVNGLEPIAVHVRVDLRCADVGVPQKLLNDAQVGPALQQVRCEAVPQRMR